MQDCGASFEIAVFISLAVMAHTIGYDRHFGCSVVHFGADFILYQEVVRMYSLLIFLHGDFPFREDIAVDIADAITLYIEGDDVTVGQCQ